MNALFFAVFTICTLSLLYLSPENFLPAMLDGAGKAATLCVSLIATYAVWMGLMRLWEDSGAARGVSRCIKPLLKRLLKTEDEDALSAVSMNVSVNLLGISGAATPYGIKAAGLLDKTDNAEYSSAMFFILNATSLQILPSSLVAVRVAMQSSNPTDIILPTFIATVFSTVLGVLLTKFAYRKRRKSDARFPVQFGVKNKKARGTYTR
jgi:spore maturation protein A